MPEYAQSISSVLPSNYCAKIQEIISTTIDRYKWVFLKKFRVETLTQTLLCRPSLRALRAIFLGRELQQAASSLERALMRTPLFQMKSQHCGASLGHCGAQSLFDNVAALKHSALRHSVFVLTRCGAISRRLWCPALCRSVLDGARVMMSLIKISWFRSRGSSGSLVYLVRGGSRPNLTEVSLSTTMGCVVQGYLVDLGFDVIREHTGSNHDRNLMVQFGGESLSSEGPGHNSLPVMSFGGKTAGYRIHATSLMTRDYLRMNPRDILDQILALYELKHYTFAKWLTTTILRQSKRDQITQSHSSIFL
ncbi:hypothetical protein M5K25_017450 [Dendrobium thyrsiflorum]|uniref:DNA-directed RNA polymerase n=1 Tax=Dendrobium thyrsiflorum TaxID=117978 RepID=A0ABD0UN22_DENTH